MKRNWIVGLAAAALAAGLTAGGFVWFREHHEVESQAEEELTLAQDFLSQAKGEGSQQRALGLLTQALDHARKAASLSEGQKLEAGLVEGEALIRLTKYSAAVDFLEKLVSAHPGNPAAMQLAADAHHQSFLLAKRDQDFGAAIQLYEEAAELGAPASCLVSAARLAEAARQYGMTDKFLETLQVKFPDSDEVALVKAMKAARPKPEEVR